MTELSKTELREKLLLICWKIIQYNGECNMYDSYCIMHSAMNMNLYFWIREAVTPEGRPIDKVHGEIMQNYQVWEKKYQIFDSVSLDDYNEAVNHY